MNNILLAQVNPIVGNLDYNYEKISSSLDYATANNADLTIFSQLALFGSPVLDLLIKYPRLLAHSSEYIKKIEQLSQNTPFLCGFCECANPDDNTCYNSLGFFADGKLKKVIRKSILPFKDEFFDGRSFVSYPFEPDDRIIEFKDKRFFVLFSNEIFNSDIVNSACNLSPDYVICVASFISRTHRNEVLNSALNQISQSLKARVLFVNQTGATDSFVTYGQSRVINNGKIVAQARAFDEDNLIFNTSGDKNRIEQSPDSTFLMQDLFNLDYDADLERIYGTVKLGIKDYFSKNNFKTAVLGLSGGLDSTVCAVLLADVLGPNNVIGVSMPSSITSKESKDDAGCLAKNLGINFYQVPIGQMTQASSVTFDDAFEKIELNRSQKRVQGSLTFDNIQARSRAMILWGISNEFSSALPIATSDKSELYMGYATINGDMSGSFAPICDITKTKLFALGRWLNKNSQFKDAIPQSVLTKPPGAELAINPDTGKPLTAEEALMPYEFLDEVIWRIEVKKQDLDSMLDDKFIYETKNKLDKDTKKAWLNKFYKRLSTSTFKGSLMPPGVICDYASINKCVSLMPITAKFIL